MTGRRGTLHHLELWRDDATAPDGPWPWLLARLGYRRTGFEVEIVASD